MTPNFIKYKLHLNIGKLNEVSMKHRSAILLISVLIYFVDPNVKITFGNASLAGLGISVEPAQTVYLGYFLLALLIYRLIAFWVSVLLESGTDRNRAIRKAQIDFEPAWEAEENRPHDMEQLIRQESEKITYKWNVRQILWEFVFPNIIALVAVITFFVQYLSGCPST
ncbi:TPA: hypothetical protein I7264_25880 [Vibrio parahaemolyticus]|nr:hypothetical protein [Vibrio parahaemolyticus]ELA6925507.1 hypothetical protein [Vibrio parahaemolyticus]HAS6615077.1 hypothetical protein [Vibrio parahaemolyticus]HAS6625554.1 hypothetical protein [Vibrio parahaemolyticus]HAS6636222.1 hypothetical protein [Vibrio parahaemolyticus]